MSTVYLWNPDPPQGYGAFDIQDEPKEKQCPKCLELKSECQCEYYDRLEKEELIHQS